MFRPTWLGKSGRPSHYQIPPQTFPKFLPHFLFPVWLPYHLWVMPTKSPPTRSPGATCTPQHLEHPPPFKLSDVTKQHQGTSSVGIVESVNPVLLQYLSCGWQLLKFWHSDISFSKFMTNTTPMWEKTIQTQFLIIEKALLKDHGA